MTEQFGGWLAAALFAGLVAMNPYAASGAAFGCFFYLAYPSSSKGLRRALLAVFSWGMGYATGIYKYPDGPPYSPQSMIWAAAVSALVVFIFLAFALVVQKKDQFPPWAETILDIIFPLRAKRGEKDGD